MPFKTITLHAERIGRAVAVYESRGLLRQRYAVHFLACLVATFLACALAACESSNAGTPVAEKQTPDLTASPTLKPAASYPATSPAPVQTGSAPHALPSVGPTLPPATAQVLATAAAATATNLAVANATATTVQATQQAVARATSFAEGTVTSIAISRQVATYYAAATQAVQATRTAFAAQTGPGSIVVPSVAWGGDGIAVHAFADTVQIKFRCDYGETFVPLTVDASGTFDLPGEYTWCPAYCMVGLPAHFRGHVNGSQLTLIVSWSNSGHQVMSEPFTATLGLAADPRGDCPVCLAGNTLIDTPNGPMPVKDLREGMLVFTEDSDTGAYNTRKIATVLKTKRTKVPAGHEMVRLVLNDGRELLASPGHPTAEGRLIGALSNGDIIDGGRVAITERVAYKEDFTYDILPSGGTGTYWANGILIGSTLAGLGTGP